MVTGQSSWLGVDGRRGPVRRTAAQDNNHKFWMNKATPSNIAANGDSNQPKWRQPKPVTTWRIGLLEYAQQQTYDANFKKLQHTCQWRVDGQTVMVIIPDAMDQLYHRGNNNLGPVVMEEVTAAMRNLVVELLPSLPPICNCRHPRKEVKQLQRKLAPKGGTIGLYHFFVRIATGQYNIPRKNKNAKMATDFSINAQMLKAVIMFPGQVKPMWEIISRLFQAINSKAYNKYLRTVRARLKTTAFGELVNCNHFIFAGFALIINLQVCLHCDVQDPPKGWVAMAPHGNFVGSNLILEQIEARVCLQKLTHSIVPFTGTRYGLVYAMNANLVLTKAKLTQFAAEDSGFCYHTFMHCEQFLTAALHIKRWAFSFSTVA